MAEVFKLVPVTAKWDVVIDGTRRQYEEYDIAEAKEFAASARANGINAKVAVFQPRPEPVETN
jgi:hypothetical protein